MLLHRLNEAFPALCTGPESPDESFFVYASRLSGELMRLREHPVRYIAFPFCCPLDFLLLFPRERRHALLAETLCFGDWLYAAAVRLYRHFSALRTVRSAEVFDAERSAWKHNPLFCTGSGALEFVRGIFSGAPLTMTDVGRLLSAETRWEGMTLKNSIARGSTSLVCRVECGEKDGVLKLPLAGAEKRFLHEMHVLQEIHHPNLPRTFRISGASPVYAVLEYCRTGSCVRSLPDSSGFLAALRFLHAKNILHGDIRLSNLGVRRDGTPVLLDFSHSRRVDGAELLREASGETERIKKLMSA